MYKIILIFLVTLLFGEEVKLTEKEKEFIKNHPVIVLGTSIGWEPYSITKADGTVDGFDSDVLKLVNKYTGAHFIEQTGNWSKIQELAKQKKIDGLATVIKTPKREEYLNFSIPYINVVTSILVKKGNPKHILSEKDLKGKIIALQKGNKYNKLLAEKWKPAKVLWYDTFLELLKAVIYGDADATYDTGTSEYILAKNGLPFLDRAFDLKNKLSLRFAIRKDYPEAISILNKGLKHIPESEFIKLRSKWFLYAPTDNILIDKEVKYLKNHNIKVCGNTDWIPIDFISKGKHKGIAVDILNIVEENIHKKFEFIKTDSWKQSQQFLKNGKCDILSAVVKTKEREKYIRFTEPYLKYKLVIITHKNLYIKDLNNLKDMTFVRKKGSGLISKIKENFPNIKIIETENLKETFNLVAKNHNYFTLAIIPVFRYYQNRYKFDLHIAGYSDLNYDIAIGTNKENQILVNILNKKLKNISQETKNAIEEKWINMEIIENYNYSLIQ